MSGVAVFRQLSSSCQAVFGQLSGSHICNIVFMQSTKSRKRVAYLGAVAVKLPCSCSAVAVQLPGIFRAVTVQSLGCRLEVKNYTVNEYRDLRGKYISYL